MTTKLTGAASAWVSRTQDDIKEWTAHATNRTVRIAVTGLKRSGKTVFTMSVVHLLKQLREQPELLAYLNIAEVHSVLVENSPSLNSARFPYESCLEALSEQPPRWPENTRDASEVRVTLRYRRLRKSIFARRRRVRTLHIDLIDYPGEWLLDLPLLNKSFEEWSQQTLALMAEPTRKQLGAEWQAFASGLDPDQSATEAEALMRQGAALYRDYLHASHAAGLQFIQPGRAILPGALEGKLLLEFFPLMTNKPALNGSLIVELERRYDTYRELVVKAFHTSYFEQFDRQVILADMLGVLNAGSTIYTDTRTALQEILKNFRYGRNNWRSRLFKHKIDRVLIAATKADRVSRDQSPMLVHFLQTMLGDTREELGDKSVGVHYQAISALCCTKDVKCRVQGHPLMCIQGTPPGASEVVTCFPGQVPARPPAEDDWQGYAFPEFAPLPGRYCYGEPLDHLKMHEVLHHLIGDKL